MVARDGDGEAATTKGSSGVREPCLWWCFCTCVKTYKALHRNSRFTVFKLKNNNEKERQSSRGNSMCKALEGKVICQRWLEGSWGEPPGNGLGGRAQLWSRSGLITLQGLCVVILRGNICILEQFWREGRL